MRKSLYEPYCPSCEVAYFIGFFMYKRLYRIRISEEAKNGICTYKKHPEGFIYDREGYDKEVDWDAFWLGDYTVMDMHSPVFCDIDDNELFGIIEEHIPTSFPLLDEEYYTIHDEEDINVCHYKNCYRRRFVDDVMQTCIYNPIEVLICDKKEFFTYLKDEFCDDFVEYITCPDYDTFKAKFDLINFVF